jgi:hypothetical protein
MKFDVVLANPPFQDAVNRGKTPHKLWIDFTFLALDKLLKFDGYLGQVSPASFTSPSNKLFRKFKELDLQYLNFDTSEHFPGVGSTFAHYVIRKRALDAETKITFGNRTHRMRMDDFWYLPNDLSELSLSIHKKVMMQNRKSLFVEHDYVTCHNIILRKGTSLSKEKSATHIYPVFHTNRQIWWSTIRQPWADELKVMWTRSGHCKPFLDLGHFGGTDMAYFVRVPDAKIGEVLANQLSGEIYQFVLKTAKWSGFGNELVFQSLPDLTGLGRSDLSTLAKEFELSPEEVEYVQRTMGVSA